MKQKRKLKTVRQVTNGGIILTVALIAIAEFGHWDLLYIPALAVGILTAVFYCKFYRCPHCDAVIRSSRSRQCTGCGQRLDL